MDRDTSDFRDVAEGSRRSQEAEHITLTTGWAQRSVLEVGVIALPFTQSLGGLGGTVSGRIVLIGEGEEVRGNSALVGLFQSRQTEGPWDEFTRGRIRHGWRLVRMKRTAVVLW